MELRKCWTCGKLLTDKQSGNFCCRRCSMKGIERSAFIRRTSKEAQLYFRLYHLEMERFEWTEREN